MTKYHITLETGEKRAQNEKLWQTIRNNGEFIKNEFLMDFIVSYYRYNGTIYALYFNDNYGYNDFIEEIKGVK